MAMKDNIRVSDYKCEVCPVCGKEFYPTPLHVYKLGTKKKKVCSYTCMLKAKSKPKKEPVRYTVYCPDGYVAQSLAEAGRHMGIEAAMVHWMIQKGKLEYETRPFGKRSETT